jgi:hypothetical protein
VAEFVLLAEGLQCLNSHKFSDQDVFVLQELLEPAPSSRWKKSMIWQRWSIA